MMRSVVIVVIKEAFLGYYMFRLLTEIVFRALIASKATFDLKVALNEGLFLGINTLLGGIPKT